MACVVDGFISTAAAAIAYSLQPRVREYQRGHHVMRVLQDLVAAFQFLTRIPLPGKTHTQDAISRSAKFFPVVGLVVALGAIGLRRALGSHLALPVAAVLVLTYLVLITGGFHEAGLADAADGAASSDNRAGHGKLH